MEIPASSRNSRIMKAGLDALPQFCRRKVATSAGVMRDVAAKGLCQFSRRTAASLKLLGFLHSSGRENVQGNRGPAHVPPAPRHSGNVLPHLRSTAEKVSQFVASAAVACR